MSNVISGGPEFLVDHHALIESVLIVGIVSIAVVGFMTGLKELAQDLRNLRKAKI